MEDKISTIPIHLKMTLTAREAAEYSNIGINKIDSMLRSPNCPFVLFVGTKKLVKRREFEAVSYTHLSKLSRPPSVFMARARKIAGTETIVKIQYTINARTK